MKLHFGSAAVEKKLVWDMKKKEQEYQEMRMWNPENGFYHPYKASRSDE